MQEPKQEQGMQQAQQVEQAQQQQSKPNNVKTALILAFIAAAFFVGIFIKRAWFS